MLAKFTKWLWDLIKSLFSPVWDFISDIFIAAVDGIVGAFAELIAAIPVPDWFAGGLAQSWGGLDPGVLWFVSSAGVPAALGIIGAGYAFRLVRKFVTLFQW